MTIEDIFDQYLKQKINLRSACKGKHLGTGENCDLCLVISRHTTLAEKLIKKLKILPQEDENKPTTFLTGSYRRHTMDRPPKDVDFFNVLDKHEYLDDELEELITPKKLLDKLEKAIEEIAKSDGLEVKRQCHSITLIYKDDFSLDIIPAFETENGQAYLIPDDDKNTYIVSNPKIHVQIANELNEKSEQVSGKKRYKRVVRLVKKIKLTSFDEDPFKMRSFHLELLAADIFQNGKINSFSQGVEKFLRLVSSYLESTGLPDPANKDNLVDDYFSEKPENEQQLIINRFMYYSEIASKALVCEQNGDIPGAVKAWEKLFPELNDVYQEMLQAEKIAQVITDSNLYATSSSFALQIGPPSQQDETTDDRRVSRSPSWKSE